MFALHPGFVRTTIAHRHQSKFFLAFVGTAQKLFGISVPKGAENNVYCACEPGLELTYSGCYFNNKKATSLWQIATDEQKAEKLWQISESMTGFSSAPSDESQQ